MPKVNNKDSSKDKICTYHRSDAAVVVANTRPIAVKFTTRILEGKNASSAIANKPTNKNPRPKPEVHDMLLFSPSSGTCRGQLALLFWILTPFGGLQILSRLSKTWPRNCRNQSYMCFITDSGPALGVGG